MQFTDLLILKPLKAMQLFSTSSSYIVWSQNLVSVVPAVPEHHARPVLTGVVHIGAFQLCSHVLALKASLIIMLDELYGDIECSAVLLFPQFCNVGVHHHIAIAEHCPTREITQVGD